MVHGQVACCVKKWQEDWTEQGKSVEFHYWGDHEIWERLSRAEHRGRYYFWFNRELCGKQWFQERLDEAVANAGVRYTPALNVELPIARLFDGLGRTTAFFKWLDDQLVAVKKVYGRAASLGAREAAQAEYEAISETMSRLSAFIDARWGEPGPIDWDTLVQLISRARAAAETCSEMLERVGSEQKEALQGPRPGAPMDRSWRETVCRRLTAFGKLYWPAARHWRLWHGCRWTD